MNKKLADLRMARETQGLDFSVHTRADSRWWICGLGSSVCAAHMAEIGSFSIGCLTKCSHPDFKQFLPPTHPNPDAPVHGLMRQ